MSPRIGTTITLAQLVPASDRPLDILRAACRIAIAQGLRIRAQEESGVALAELGVGWRTTHHRREVNLAGAVVMARQPEPLSREDQADVVAARVLDVTWMWVLGAVDGWSNEPNPQLLTGVDRDVYLLGVRAGGLVFAELTIECPCCGDRRLPLDDDCSCTGARRR